MLSAFIQFLSICNKKTQHGVFNKEGPLVTLDRFPALAQELTDKNDYVILLHIFFGPLTYSTAYKMLFFDKTNCRLINGFL